MMEDLDKDTVDYAQLRRDHRRAAVLPTAYPNLLVNGSTGIAVGMATNIPPHNMREVIDGVLWVIEQTLMAGADAAPVTREQKLQGVDPSVPGPTSRPAA
jgi:DNA gyrase subunit A